MTTFAARVTDHITFDGTMTPAADDHRRGNVAADLVRLVAANTIGAQGAKGSDERRQLRASMWTLQNGQCAWCDGDMEYHEMGSDRMELDRVAKGREYLVGCGGGCDRECRCGYALGAVVGAHARCHRDPNGTGAIPLRYRLPADEVRARAGRILRAANERRFRSASGKRVSAYRTGDVPSDGRI